MRFFASLKFKRNCFHYSEELRGWTDDFQYPPRKFDTEDEALAYTKQKQDELVARFRETLHIAQQRKAELIAAQSPSSIAVLRYCSFVSKSSVT